MEVIGLNGWLYDCAIGAIDAEWLNDPLIFNLLINDDHLSGPCMMNIDDKSSRI